MTAKRVPPGGGALPRMRFPWSSSFVKSAGVSSVTHISVDVTWSSGNLWFVAGASIQTTALPLASWRVTMRRTVIVFSGAHQAGEPQGDLREEDHQEYEHDTAVEVRHPGAHDLGEA